MISKKKNFDYFAISSSFIFILIIPGLVSGPAIPDMIVSILSIAGLFFFIKRKRKYEFDNLIYFILIFYIYINFNSIVSDYFLFSIKSSLVYVRFLFFSFFVFILLKKFNLKLINIFFIISLTTILFVGFDSLKQYYSGINFFGMESTNSDRPSSLFGEELIQGSFIIRNSPLILGLFYFIFYKKIKNKLFFSYLLILIFLINLFIVISGERSSLVLLLIFDFAIFISIPINIKLKFYCFISITFILTFLLIKFDTVKERMIVETYNQIFNQGNIYFFSEQHQSHYLSAIKMFKDNPLLGLGPNAFRFACKDDKYFVNELSCSTHPHNTYLQLLGETGSIGFIFILITYSFLIKLYLKSLKNLVNNFDFFKYFLVLSFCMNFFPFLPSGNFFNNWINIIYYLPLGFYFYIKDKDKDKNLNYETI